MSFNGSLICNLQLGFLVQVGINLHMDQFYALDELRVTYLRERAPLVNEQIGLTADIRRVKQITLLLSTSEAYFNSFPCHIPLDICSFADCWICFAK
jgi:hypothetical protein